MMKIFDEHYKKYDAWYDKNKFTYLAEARALKKVLPKKGKGLEIGVGTGRFASALGIEYGADPSKKMLKIAGKRGVKTYMARGERLPFNGKTFDYAAIIVTLSFVKSPEKVLSEAARILKPGGKIIIGMIDRESFLGRHYLDKRGIFYGKANILSVKEAICLLERAGFKRLAFYQTIFRIPEKIKTIHKTIRGTGRGGFAVISAYKK